MGLFRAAIGLIKGQDAQELGQKHHVGAATLVGHYRFGIGGKTRKRRTQRQC